MSDPHAVTKQFEAALCEYTGARYAVTTTSCTQALLMALAYCSAKGLRGWESDRHPAGEVNMPRRSYVGVPASILSAGYGIRWVDLDWEGEYKLSPLPVWDSARRFTREMFRPLQMQCVSFHWGKILGLSQGGAILHDNAVADAWLRRARFDGRREGVSPKDDQVSYPSWHAYLSPEVAAHGLMKLSLLPDENADLPWSDYPDLSQQEAFK